MAEARALFVAPATPARTGNGLAMRLATFHDALSRVAAVDTLVLPLSGPPPDLGFADAFGDEAMTVEVAGRVDTQFALLSRLADPTERLRQFRLYGRGSRHAPLSAAVLADIRRTLEGRRYDLAHLGRLYLSDAVASITATRTSLDLDEDDAWAWRRLAATQLEPQADWSEAEAVAEDRLLARRGPSFDARFIAGEADRLALNARHPGLPVEIVPNAIAFPPAARRDDGQTLLFVGAFGYPPNSEGILWFIDAVWPTVRAAAPAVRLRLVGRDPPAAIRTLHGRDNIELIGPVDDVAPAYAEATLAIAPLRTGGGTRLKLIEAAAHAVPIITTGIAARGLDFIAPDSAWQADEATAFADAILAALADPVERNRRAARAYQRARATHDRVEVVERLAERFARMLQTADATGTRP